MASHVFHTYASSMRRLAAPTVLILALAACGGSTAETTTSTAPTDTSAPEAATTTTSAPPEPTVTTLESTTDVPADASGAMFAITMVSLGDLGQVVVQNVGSEAGSLAGFWLCQRPSYYEFPDVELAPGASAAVSVGGDLFAPPPGAIAIEGVADIGPFDPTDGEVGLYLDDTFGNPDAIVSYVEWGRSGHGRSETAVSAQIWPDGGFVETTEATGAILATVIPPTEPAHWTSG